MSEFTFENPYWLLLILTAPAAYFLLKALYKKVDFFNKQIEVFADKKLLPHLVTNYSPLTSIKNKILLWSLLWIFACFTLAGPRWGYEEMETYNSNSSLVILLDLSNSMNASDVKPSRMVRAKQEIEDILRLKDPGVKIALIGFSATPHLITPLTFDTKTIINLLPYIDSSLVSLEGSDLSAAIQMVNKLLKDNNSYSKSALVMSDGGFDDFSKDVSSDISLSFMGFGTRNGAPIPNNKGNFLKNNGQIVIDKLQDQKMRDMVNNGGRYIAANFLDNDSKEILSLIKIQHEKAQKEKNDKLIYYNEVFYIPLSLMMIAMMIIFFKRGAVISLAILWLIFPNPAQANIFLNKQQQARKAYNQKDYETAIEKFDDNYQKGVAQYRAGQYDRAEESFTNSTNVKGKYNLGNAFFKQRKFDRAIDAYEQALELNPGDKDAQHNLRLAKQLLKQQPKGQDKDEDSKEKEGQGVNSPEQKKVQGKSEKEEEDSSRRNDKRSEEEGEKSGEANNKGEEEEVRKKEVGQSQKEEEEGEGKEEESKKGEEGSDLSKEQQRINEQNQKRDFNADKQLNRIKSNPANILKNQFYIEEQRFLLKQKEGK